MKRVIILLIAFCINIINAEAQQSGIHFENLSWQRVKEKAKKENKYIFVDCYATWCGPCKFMSQNIFPQKSVGDFVNSKFISVEVQMDRTTHDDDYIKSWYNDAASFATEYDVTAYPTYLFFSPEGTAVHRFEGSTNDGDVFISKVKDVFDPNKQLYTVIGHYKEHLQDSAYLKRALTFATSAKNDDAAAFLAEKYLASIKYPLNKDNLMILVSAVKSDTGAVFQFFLNHAKKIDEILGDHVLRAVIYNSEILPQFFLTSNPSVDWTALSKKLKNEYGDIADSLILSSKITYYRWKKNDQKYEETVTEFMKIYSNRLGAFDLNDFAWNAFSFSNNESFLKKALSWSKDAIKKYPDVDWEFVDTYANLLYKTGNSQDAIVWEKKAIALIDSSKDDIRKSAAAKTQKADLVSNLNKMRNGQKTWN